MSFLDSSATLAARAFWSNSPEAVWRLIYAAADNDPDVISEFRGADIHRDLSDQRHAIAWVARNHIGASLPQIGRALNRDHSTIHRSCRRAVHLRAQRPDFRAMCDWLASVASEPFGEAA